MFPLLKSSLTHRSVSKIGGKVTDKVDTCLATCVHGSEGLDFMDYDYYDYPEDYDYYLEDPDDSEGFDYEDSMDLEDYVDFEDEDSEDFELIAGPMSCRKLKTSSECRAKRHKGCIWSRHSGRCFRRSEGLDLMAYSLNGAR